MHRLSRPLQRVQSVGGWRALLAADDDAACSRACGQGDARLAAADARFGMRRGARAHSGAPLAAEAGVVCACVLERLPIVVPPQPAWEVEFQDWRYEKLKDTFKTYPKELVQPKATDEDESKQSWSPAALPKDDTGNRRSPDRKPQDNLFLVVKKADGSWEFPQAAHAAGETPRQVAERALAQTASGLDTYSVGNAPAAHLALPHSTLFFMRASYLGGSLQLVGRSGVTDWAWVTKEELAELVGQAQQAVIAQAV